jgi:hypothetical protein
MQCTCKGLSHPPVRIELVGTPEHVVLDQVDTSFQGSLPGCSLLRS